MSEALDIKLQVDLSGKSIEIGVDTSWKNIGIGVEKGGAVYPPYTGNYHIIPTLYWQQRLETYGKSMTDDVLVDAIRITETTNPQGGKTVVIG